MEKPQIWGIAGCALLLLGGVAPLLSMGGRSVCFYDLPFFYKGTFVVMILASGYLIWKKDYKPMMLTATVILLLFLGKFMDAINMPFMVDMSYGWWVLLAGIMLLSKASTFRWRDGLRALIPRDLSGGAAFRSKPPPPPVKMPPSSTVAPPPPMGAMPPPPPPILGMATHPFTGVPVCLHCRAPVSTSAKFCRTCGGPLPAMAAAPPPPISPSSGRICRKCQSPLSATAKFCRTCGVAAPPGTMPPTNCPRCGVHLDPEERFCSGCGQQITPA